MSSFKRQKIRVFTERGYVEFSLSAAKDADRLLEIEGRGATVIEEILEVDPIAEPTLAEKMRRIAGVEEIPDPSPGVFERTWKAMRGWLGVGRS